MKAKSKRDVTQSGLTRFTFFIPVEDLTELREIGQSEDRDPSWLIRKAVRDFIETYKGKKK
jgi:predicted transcriptional regulator